MKRFNLVDFEGLVHSSDRKELGVFFLACVVELLHKKNELTNRLDTDFSSDISYCEKSYNLNKGICSDINSFTKFPNSLMNRYKEIKKNCQWDSCEQIEETVNRLVGLFSGKASFSHFSEYRFSKALSEWICDGRTNLKAYFPYSSLIDAVRYIGENSKVNDVINVAPLKSTIDNILMALFDISINTKLDDFDKLTDAKKDYYDVGFSVPPFGIKLENNDNLENALIENMDASIKGRFACIVPSGFAFNSLGKQKILREKLVKSKRLAAIVELPNGYIAGTALSTIALLFDYKEANNNEVLMIDLSDSKYKDEQLSFRSNFVLNDSAIKVFSDAIKGNLSSKCEKVSIDKIATNDYLLLPSRYALSEDMKESIKKFNEYKSSKTLSSIAYMYRAQATKNEGDGKEYYEVGASDINEYGFINAPEKTLLLTPQSSSLKNKLQKNDIIFSIKGTVGKVAFIDKDVDNWIVNQSFVIIRVTDETYTPEYVFKQLTSKVTRDYIALHAAGNVIKSFPIDKLKDFRVQDPTKESLCAAKEKTQRQIEILKAIEDLKKELSEI